MDGHKPIFASNFAAHNVLSLIFGRLDSTTLAIAAIVCKPWRRTALKTREKEMTFRLVLVDLLAVPTLLSWALSIWGLPPRLGEKACTLAAQKGSIEGLRILRGYGYPWGAETCAAAAREGHLGLLQWARANGCGWSWDTCAAAAEGGHLDVLQWARKKGSKWDKKTCAWAAGMGHLKVLQWARAKGCPWDRDQCNSLALVNGHKNIVAWIESLDRLPQLMESALLEQLVGPDES